MAKKFFYNKVYNTKRTIINAIIIGACIIGVILCFIVVSNTNVKNLTPEKGNLSIKNEVTVEVNQKFKNDIFFSEVKNVDLDKIEVTYSLDYNIEIPGTYDVTIKVNEKEYPTKINVVDTTMPDLKLKKHTIALNKSYSAMDFVESCKDNSNKECQVEFYEEKDEAGNLIKYNTYTKEGTYSVKIKASDESGNEVVKETELTIGNPKTNPKPKPEPSNPPTPPATTTCKYGNNEYDKNLYILTIDKTTNKCAVSLDLYKDDTMTKEINARMSAETTRIKKDVEALNLKGTLALNRKVTAVVNTTGNGIVGYELQMKVSITNNNKSEVVVDFKVDSKGKRIFTTNPYKLSN